MRNIQGLVLKMCTVIHDIISKYNTGTGTDDLNFLKWDHNNVPVCKLLEMG